MRLAMNVSDFISYPVEGTSADAPLDCDVEPLPGGEVWVQPAEMIAAAVAKQNPYLMVKFEP